MRLFLIGFMGAGKSHTGRKLAARLGLPFIDLDELIEDRAGCSIATLFAGEGEDAFRRTEAEVLRDAAQLPMFVMATGGGTPCFNDNLAYMHTRGVTLFLDPEEAILLSRLKRERDKRPLLKNGEPLADLIARRLQQRRPCYEKAIFHVRQTNPKQDVIRLILAQLERFDSILPHD